MSRQVSPALSAYIALLLDREKPRFASQNKMAKTIGIPGGTLSNIMTKTKGVGAELLPKLTAFLKKTREELEAEAEAADGTRIVVTNREERRTGSLERVRDRLRERYSDRRAEVDAVVGGSEFIDAQNLDELEAFTALDDILRMGRAESKGKLIVSKGSNDEHSDEESAGFTDAAFESLKSRRERISERPSASRSKRTRK